MLSRAVSFLPYILVILSNAGYFSLISSQDFGNCCTTIEYDGRNILGSLISYSDPFIFSNPFALHVMSSDASALLAHMKRLLLKPSVSILFSSLLCCSFDTAISLLRLIREVVRNRLLLLGVSFLLGVNHALPPFPAVLVYTRGRFSYE